MSPYRFVRRGPAGKIALSYGKRDAGPSLGFGIFRSLLRSGVISGERISGIAWRDGMAFPSSWSNPGSVPAICGGHIAFYFETVARGNPSYSLDGGLEAVG